jgi:ketosteroid isomerase-like protein
MNSGPASKPCPLAAISPTRNLYQNKNNMKQALTFLLIMSFINCGRKNIDLKVEQERIVKCWSDWDAKSKAGDPAYYWTDDVIIMGPGAPTIKGKEEFLEMFSSMQKIPGFNMAWDKEPSSIEISKDGQMAYLFAKNKVTMTDSTGAANSLTNQVLQIWNKDKDGNWRAAVSVMYPDAQAK